MEMEPGIQFDGIASEASQSIAVPEKSDTLTLRLIRRYGKEKSVARRRFQRGSVFLNKSKTQWLGMYAEYVLNQHGVEQRLRKQVVLCPVKLGDKITRKRDAQRLLQPYLDRVNSSLATPARCGRRRG